jgi:hypothetical protein
MYPSDEDVEYLIDNHPFPYSYVRRPRNGAEETVSGANMGHPTWRSHGGDGPIEVAGLGTVELIDQEGGGYGSGDYIHNIYRVIFPNNEVKLYKKEGGYSSYGGYEWDGDFRETRVVEKTILVYE